VHQYSQWRIRIIESKFGLGLVTETPKGTYRMAGNQMTEADVIVLGVGTCGEDLSLQLLDAGLSVIGIEASLVGGECAYWACIPSKMMIRAANILQEGRRTEGVAGHADVRAEWAQVAKRITTEATGGWDDSFAVERFESRGGRIIHGRGKLAGPRTVTVGDETLTAKIGVVIATGSQPAIPPIDGLDSVDYWTTHDVISAEELPESLIVLGGGPIGCELGQVLSRFGVRVTIVEAAGRLLPGEEPEASDSLAMAFEGEGIDVKTGDLVVTVDSSGGDIEIVLASGEKLSANKMLVATGRKVDLTGLGLESVGLPTAGFIEVDERMHAADGLWAMGDMTGKAMFTHVAVYQSGIIAADILKKEHAPARYDAVPRAVFTDPEVGSVGITEAQAREQGLDVEVAVKRTPYTFRGWLDMSMTGAIKVIADRKSGVLLGASASGPRASEILGLLTFAVHTRAKLDDLRSMIYAFPTFYGGVGEAIGAYALGVQTVLDPEFEGLQPIS
jgi:pyruvate/2-oxoglutarate dehydrogenase complex dihydrolipoamide dehydrogenase (E3) component